MARLSTPSHACEQRMVNGETMEPISCRLRAYRRGPDRKWYCKKHMPRQQ